MSAVAIALLLLDVGLAPKPTPREAADVKLDVELVPLPISARAVLDVRASRPS